jgi:hypothetical protein
MKQGGDYHSIKPMVCWMFPVIYDLGILRASFDVTNDLVCVDQGPSLYRSARGELEHFFGKAFVEELDGVEARWMAESGQMRSARSSQT